MTDDEVLAKITAVVGEVLERPELKLDGSTRARDVEGWDSMSMIEIVIALEHEYGIRFRTGELAAMDDVGALVRYVQKHIS